jgi:carbon storage regulator
MRAAYAANASMRATTEGRDPVLVLTRRANQSIMIGHEIVVTVLEVRGDQVRLGIKAPRSIDVHREEIFAQLQQANRDAAGPSKEGLEGLTEMQAGATEPTSANSDHRRH